MRHLIDPMDLSVEDIDRLLDRADDIAKNPEKYQEVCKHKKLATLFFEPSTRTRLSFEAAMLELGGSVLGFSSADSSSASKGESVADTARVIECYADIIGHFLSLLPLMQTAAPLMRWIADYRYAGRSSLALGRSLPASSAQ